MAFWQSSQTYVFISTCSQYTNFNNSILNNFISFCSSKERLKKIRAEIEQEKKIKEELQRGNDKTSPTKSDDSGYSSANSFDDDPMVEQLVSNIKNDFDEKATLPRDSSNLQSIKCRINTNLYTYVQSQ